ncbi:T9SS type A sorting domain-containing protein, partial [Flavobacterium sp. SM15]|uniref:GEVED domain-containing protein n=1 Tax=Flavobacterium sp. SM15 TaxID=2908005 RepID=UPI001EDBDC7F
TTATTLVVASLSASTTYNFYVKAKDTAGNVSSASNTVIVTTSALADTSLPTASTLSASGTTTSSTNLSWTAATDNVGVTGYDVYQNGVLKTTTTATTLAVAGLSASTTYNFYVKAKDAAGNASSASNTVIVTTMNNGASYCTSSGSTAREYINRVQFGSINNLSGNNNGYGNYTSQSTSISTGSTVTITITPAWNGTSTNEAHSVWIDYNQDGNFASNELVFSKSKSKASNVSGSFIIPSTALQGATRMRVSMKYNSAAGACDVFANGEVEDYTVIISTGTTAKPEIDTETEETIVNTATKEAINNTATENKEINKLSFNLYPNPVKDGTLFFSGLNEDTTTSYRIYNLLGQQLAAGTIENNAVNVGSVKEGTYIIEVSDGRSTTSKKFIKN